jgi:hypothetical protein
VFHHCRRCVRRQDSVGLRPAGSFGGIGGIPRPRIGDSMVRLQGLVDTHRCSGSGSDGIAVLVLVKEVGAAKRVMVGSREKMT